MSQTSVRESSPLKIGVMLRGIDGKGGIGIYCQNLIDHLLAIDNVNRYILYYAKQGTWCPAVSIARLIDSS